MARDRRVGRVRQAELLQAGAPLLRGHLRARHRRQEAFSQHLLDIAGQQRRLDRAAHQPRAFAQNGDRRLFRFRARLQQLFLGHATVGPQRQVLPAVDPRALLGQAMRHHAGQRQVHVVAAQQDVLAHRHAVQRKLAVRFRHRNQREVRGAAADIHHQDQVAHRHPLAPVRMTLQPRVESRLRLFQQGDVLVPGLPGGVQRQFARHRVERCGDGDQHLLRLERRVRHFGVPRLPHVLQVAAAGLHRRDLRHAFRRAEGKQRRGAVHRRVRQPALGRRHQPPRILHAALLRQAAHRIIARFVPRQSQAAGREVRCARQIEERGQQVFVAHLARIGELRNRQKLHVGGRERVGVRADLRVGGARIGGAEIDPDHVLR